MDRIERERDDEGITISSCNFAYDNDENNIREKLGCLVRLDAVIREDFSVVITSGWSVHQPRYSLDRRTSRRSDQR